MAKPMPIRTKLNRLGGEFPTTWHWLAVEVENYPTKVHGVDESGKFSSKYAQIRPPNIANLAFWGGLFGYIPV